MSAETSVQFFDPKQLQDIGDDDYNGFSVTEENEILGISSNATISDQQNTDDFEQDSNGLLQNSNVIAQDSNVVAQDSNVVAQDSNVVAGDSNSVEQDLNSDQGQMDTGEAEVYIHFDGEGLTHPVTEECHNHPAAIGDYQLNYEDAFTATAAIQVCEILDASSESTENFKTLSTIKQEVQNQELDQALQNQDKDDPGISNESGIRLPKRKKGTKTYLCQPKRKGKPRQRSGINYYQRKKARERLGKAALGTDFHTDYYSSLVNADGLPVEYEEPSANATATAIIADSDSTRSSAGIISNGDQSNTREEFSIGESYMCGSTKHGPVRLVYSKRGQKRLELDGRLYRHDITTSGGVIRWRCAVDYCKGRVKSTQFDPLNTLEVVNDNHNHGRDIKFGKATKRNDYKSPDWVKKFPKQDGKWSTRFNNKYNTHTFSQERHLEHQMNGFMNEVPSSKMPKMESGADGRSEMQMQQDKLLIHRHNTRKNMAKKNEKSGPNRELLQIIRRMKEQQQPQIHYVSGGVMDSSNTNISQPSHLLHQGDASSAVQIQEQPKHSGLYIASPTEEKDILEKQILRVQLEKLQEEKSFLSEQRKLVMEKRYNVRLKKIMMLKELKQGDPDFEPPPPEFQVPVLVPLASKH